MHYREVSSDTLNLLMVSGLDHFSRQNISLILFCEEGKILDELQFFLEACPKLTLRGSSITWKGVPVNPKRCLQCKENRALETWDLVSLILCTSSTRMHVQSTEFRSLIIVRAVSKVTITTSHSLRTAWLISSNLQDDQRWWNVFDFSIWWKGMEITEHKHYRAAIYRGGQKIIHTCLLM